jgi:hypothetical protein
MPHRHEHLPQHAAIILGREGTDGNTEGGTTKTKITPSPPIITTIPRGTRALKSGEERQAVVAPPA